MAQKRMTYQALLDQLQGADTDVLRRVLEHAMQLARAWGDSLVFCSALSANNASNTPRIPWWSSPGQPRQRVKRRDVTGRSDPAWIPAIPSMSPYPISGCSHVLA
jgi:hypothetical protein